MRYRRTAVIYDQTDRTIEHVISTFAKACASGKIGTACRTADGGIEVTNPKWQRGKFTVRGYFVDGRDEGRAILVWVEDLDRFVARLTPVSAAPPEGEAAPAASVVEASPSPVATASAPDPKPREKRRGREPGANDRFGDRALFSRLIRLMKKDRLSDRQAATQLAMPIRLAGQVLSRAGHAA